MSRDNNCHGDGQVTAIMQTKIAVHGNDKQAKEEDSKTEDRERRLIDGNFYMIH